MPDTIALAIEHVTNTLDNICPEIGLVVWGKLLFTFIFRMDFIGSMSLNA